MTGVRHRLPRLPPSDSPPPQDVLEFLVIRFGSGPKATRSGRTAEQLNSIELALVRFLLPKTPQPSEEIPT